VPVPIRCIELGVRRLGHRSLPPPRLLRSHPSSGRRGLAWFTLRLTDYGRPPTRHSVQGNAGLCFEGFWGARAVFIARYSRLRRAGKGHGNAAPAQSYWEKRESTRNRTGVSSDSLVFFANLYYLYLRVQPPGIVSTRNEATKYCGSGGRSTVIPSVDRTLLGGLPGMRKQEEGAIRRAVFSQGPTARCAPARGTWETRI
jgi:hypothetical protein